MNEVNKWHSGNKWIFLFFPKFYRALCGFVPSHAEMWYILKNKIKKRMINNLNVQNKK